MACRWLSIFAGTRGSTRLVRGIRAALKRGVGMVSRWPKPRRLLRLIGVALGFTAVITAGLFAHQWFGLLFTRSVLRRAAIAFLVGLETAYVLALAALLAGMAGCGTWLWRRSARRYEVAAGRPRRVTLLLLHDCDCRGRAYRRAEAVGDERRDSTVKVERDLPERFVERAPGDGLTLAVLGESSVFGTPFERLALGRENRRVAA